MKIKNICHLTRSLMIALLIASTFSQIALAAVQELKESWQRDLDYEEKMRLAELLRGLDVPYQQRKPIVEKIVGFGLGPNNRLVEDQLVDALNFDNMQIRMAVIEIMAKIGNANKFIPAIGHSLVVEPFIDVRIKAVHCLPAFMIENYKERLEAITFLDADVYTMTDNLKKILRAPPLKRNRREIDHSKSRTRTSIINVLAKQLDPVGTALDGLKIKNKQIEIKALIQNLTSERFEGDLHKIKDKWLRLRSNAEINDLNFVNTIQQEASRVLSDIGAIEAWKDITELSKVNRNTAKIAAAKTFMELTAYAQEVWEVDEDILSGPFFYPHDIYNWQELCSEIFMQSKLSNNRQTFGAVLMEYLPTEAKLAISKTSQKNNGEISEMTQKNICDAFNKVFSNYDFFIKIRNLFLNDFTTDPILLKQYNKEKYELSNNEIMHLSRLIFEKGLKSEVRFHKYWRKISEEENIWRLERQQNCKNLMSNAHNFARSILDKAESDDSLRRYAYIILGNSRKTEVVPMLYEWAARKEKERALLTEICEALGQIGGVAAVKALGQLANYKGYSSSVTQLQKEYRYVFTAFNALAQIARRPADKGNKLAVNELTKHLNDKRNIPGLPSIKKQALWQLRYSFQEGRTDLTPEQWLIAQENYLKTKSGQKRLSVDFNIIN